MTAETDLASAWVNQAVHGGARAAPVSKGD